MAQNLMNQMSRQKTNTDKVVEKTKTKHTIDGKKLFASKDYLTCEEITAAFS